GIQFTDALPAGLTVPDTGATSTCGGSYSISSNVISFSGGTLAANGTCNFSVQVSGAQTGVYNNKTGVISSTESGAGSTSNTATLTVIGPPSISKGFGSPTIPLNGTTTLTFTITNPNSTTTLSGVGFTDSLPSGLQVAATPGAST